MRGLNLPVPIYVNNMYNEEPFFGRNLQVIPSNGLVNFDLEIEKDYEDIRFHY